MTNFQSQNSHTNLLFRKTFVLKFEDKINLENILFISKSINDLLLYLLNNWFVFSDTQNIILHGLLMINPKNIHTELTLSKNLITLSGIIVRTI